MSLLNHFDKTQLSNITDLIRDGRENLDNKILALKPHELRAEGYSESDVEDAEAKSELADELLIEITALMELCDEVQPIPEARTYPDLFQFAKTLEDEWGARGRVEWQEAADLMGMILKMEEQDRQPLASIVDVLDDDDWDSEFVASWPTRVMIHLSDTQIGLIKMQRGEDWLVFDARLSGELLWVATVNQEAVADSLIGLYQ